MHILLADAKCLRNCQIWQSGVSSEQKSKDDQAIIGLCESTAAGGGPTAGGGVGICGLLSAQTRWEKKGRPNIRTSSRVFSAIILCIPIPTPSITANRIAHPMAEFLAALNPPRIANEPPVRNPAPTRTPSAFESLGHPAPIPCSLSSLGADTY